MYHIETMCDKLLEESAQENMRPKKDEADEPFWILVCVSRNFMICEGHWGLWKV
jgi:hypothetical protein